MLALLLAAALGASAAPQKVVVGAYLNDLQSLDLKTHSYAADVYVWFRWREAKLDPASSMEVMNPYELWALTRVTDYERPLRLPTGELYQVVRLQGRFSTKMDLGDYPFDEQVLSIDLEDSRLTADDLEYSADPMGAARAPDLRLPGYVLGETSLKIFPRESPTRFGDPRAGRPAVFSRARLELPISRPPLTYSVKLLLPIACVIFCAALMSFFEPRHVDARVGIGITALLTIVALQITLNADLPDVDYLVLMDKIYLGAYLFVITGLALVVRTTKHHTPRALRFERVVLGSCLAAYLAAVAALVAVSA